MGPEGVVGRSAVHRLDDAEEVLEPVLAGEGVSLHVEEQVARRRVGKSSQTQAGLHRLDELVADVTRRPLLDLETGLAPQAVEGAGSDSWYLRS